MRSRAALALLSIGAFAAVSGGIACASDSDKPSNDPIFGSRTDNPDGSSAMTVGRKLPTEWETKIGTDMKFGPQQSSLPSENFATGTLTDRSTGSVWGSIVMPGFQPLGFDKAAVEARLDSASDAGKVGAKLSRTMPLGRAFSMTWENGYSVTQPLAQTPEAQAALPLVTNPPAAVMGVVTATQARTVDQTLKFNYAPWGTTFSAGASSSNTDSQWHNKFSIEQTVVGPLKITTSVEDPGSVASNKSITAGFKKIW